MSKDQTHYTLGVSFTNGARREGTAKPTEFYDPMRADSRQARIDNSIYGVDAQKAALTRRVGFPSYLNMPKNDG